MRRGRVVILVILIILVIVSLLGVGLLFFVNRTPQKSPGTTVTTGGVPTTAAPVEVTPTSEVVMILAAGQTLERGVVIPTEAVVAIPWPKNVLPFSAVTDTAKIVGNRARITIARGEPIFDTMVLKGLETPSASGSDAAVQIPPGKVAISLPYDANNGVAQALKDGDHISLIASWRVVNLDESFQSALPNSVLPLVVPVEGGQPGETKSIGVAGPLGHMTPVPGGSGDNANVYVVPSEPMQRFRLVTQVILKDAIILHMGRFGENAPMVIESTPTAVPNATPATSVPPTATPAPPRILTLIVDPKDALAINYLNRMAEKYPDAVQVTLVLRSAGDTSLVDTPSVTQQYMFENFDIQVPTRLDYGVWGTPVAPTAVPAP